MANPPASPAVTFSSSSAAAEAVHATSSTLSPHAAPYTLRARSVCAAPELGDASRLIDGNLEWLAAYIGVESCDTISPGSVLGMQCQPSSSSGIQVNAYPSSASSTSVYTWMTSNVKQEQFPLALGEGRSGNKSTKVTIKSPPNRTQETNNISFGSKSKLPVRESDDCNNGHSLGTMDLNPVLNPLCIPSARASSPVSVADDVNPDPSERSVDSPCYKGKASSVKHHEESLVASKDKQNLSQPHVELRLSEKTVHVDTKLKNDSRGKELKNAEYGAGRCNAADKYCLEVRNNYMKQSGLNSAAPDFIPSSVRKSSTGNGLPSSTISLGFCSSTGRNTSEILKAIKSLSELLQTIYSDDIEFEECDLSLLSSIFQDLKNLYKARKGPAKVAHDKAELKDCNFQNAVAKPVAVRQDGTYTMDKGKGIIVSNVADYSHPPVDFGRNSLTGYQPAPNNLRKESYEDEHSQVHIFKKLWIEAEHANCALKYQLKQTLMKIDQESSMAHNGGGPRNPFHLCDMVSDPSSSVELALTCPPIPKDHPGVRKSPNLIHTGGNNVLSRSEETSIRHRLQLVPNKFLRGLNLSISDGLSPCSYNTGRDNILPASHEFGSSDWEHVLKDEII